MKPRLANSKKWTAFPKEFSEQIRLLFQQNFAAQLKKAKLVVEGRIYAEEILFRIGYLEDGRLKQSNFEVSIEHSQTQKNSIDQINLAVDAIASLFMEYFEKEGEVEGNLDFPLKWKEIMFNGHKLFMQYSTVNTELEAAADALLGVDKEDSSLVREEPDEDDPLLEEIEGALDEEGPQMFGPPKKKKTPLH